MKRSVFHSLIVALLLSGAAVPSLRGDDPFLTFVFGPGFAENARQGARSAAATARQWLRSPGAQVEIRRAGNPEAKRIDLQIPAKALQEAFLEAATQARDTDPDAFLAALDAAAQAAALHSGTKVVAALLNSPPLSTDAEKTLEHLVDFCRTRQVRVVVLDSREAGNKDSGSALESLATRTGGKSLRQAKDLESNILALARTAAEEAPDTSASAPVAPEPGAQGQIPVHTRFVRTSGTSMMSVGTVAQLAETDSRNSTVALVERPYEANEATGPMLGLMLVESPLNALKFDTDENTNTYLARARIFAIIRNSKGHAVWSGQKEVSIRGPLAKLDTRRQGNLVLMRGVTLPGERYTLEAKVEDLLANTAGTVQKPLRTGRGVPGLMASDAMIVRPFRGSADRFEADQVFSYEGEALSPMLDPVFRSEDPINLQLYLVLYPDINGAPPDLNVELQREGRVVARMPLQFQSQLRNLALEGKFSTIAGKGSAILGGRAREFPYLANMKGARLSPGNYDAIVSIRQGRSVITRGVAFRVAGNGNAPVEIAGGPGIVPVALAEPETDVVLPEIQPATMESGGLVVSAEEQKKLWDVAAEHALEYSSRLPNFRCMRETHRFTAPAKAPEQLKATDTFKDELTYEDGKESYRTLEINGTKPNASRGETKGVYSRGEFGSMLHGIFERDFAATYKWAGRAIAMGVLCQVFDIDVPKGRSNFTLTHKTRSETAGYTGRVFVDEETGLVRRVTIQGVGLPKDFALQSPSFSLEYGMVRIGAADYLLPLRSVLQLRQGKALVRNETVFSGYRKFEASSGIKFESE